jgi:hypothetical protein
MEDRMGAEPPEVTGLDGDAVEVPGAALDRPAEVKAAYDPENRFRINPSIPPAPAVGA